ncbi:fimbrial biogenesis chaperone [Providencia rettgeri]|uniref:fimbrial biogenesis chaperone n=1 Tax=Providencia rettgeri TaxID=587 RepID=UPI00206DC307|nr:molecular chaperone [Providencia rettgeri]UPS61506.1 molecular chaperone [Providencia rettgeri]
MQRIFSTIFYSFIALGAMCCSILSYANGFGINATRLVYPERSKDISTTVRNTTDNVVYLVQAGISRAQDSMVSAPFTVTPPLFRLEPNSVNLIRITLNATDLPKDRESVFYLHTSALPASKKINNEQASDDIPAAIQFAVGNIIKVFYRPTNLLTTSEEAQKNLKFLVMENGLKVVNDSPYYVSLSSLTVGGKKIPLNTPEELMISPFSNHVYPMKNTAGVIEWKTINDIGGNNAYTSH